MSQRIEFERLFAQAQHAYRRGFTACLDVAAFLEAALGGNGLRDVLLDAQRLDFLEGELDREQAFISAGITPPQSCFRVNVAITRKMIDGAMRAHELAMRDVPTKTGWVSDWLQDVSEAEQRGPAREGGQT